MIFTNDNLSLPCIHIQIIAYLNEELNKWQLGMSSAKPLERSSRGPFGHHGAYVTPMSATDKSASTHPTHSRTDTNTNTNVKAWNGGDSPVRGLWSYGHRGAYVTPRDTDKSISEVLAQAAKYTGGKFGPEHSTPAHAHTHAHSSVSALSAGMDKSKFLVQVPLVSPSRLDPTEALSRPSRVLSDDSAKKVEERHLLQQQQQQQYNDEEQQQENILPGNGNGITNATTTTTTTNRASKDLEIYMKGMRNLGLTEESLSGLEELDLSFDDEPVLTPAQPYSTHLVSTAHSARVKEYYAQSEQESNDFSHSNLDVLEAMDYYSTTSGVGPVGNSSRGH